MACLTFSAYSLSLLDSLLFFSVNSSFFVVSFMAFISSLVIVASHSAVSASPVGRLISSTWTINRFSCSSESKRIQKRITFQSWIDTPPSPTHTHKHLFNSLSIPDSRVVVAVILFLWKPYLHNQNTLWDNQRTCPKDKPIKLSSANQKNLLHISTKD